MSVMREGLERLRSFFGKAQRDADLEAELASHLEMATEENVRRGMPMDEARRAAKVRFGGVEQAKEAQRASRGLPGLDTFLQDLRYTLRTLRRDRGFAVVAIVILALGVGANIAVFSVVETIVLRPLPFDDSQRLVWIAPADAKGLSDSTYSVDAMEDLRTLNRSYADVTGYYAFSTSDNFKLTGYGEPRPLTSIGVAGNFFHVLGVQPFLGRAFTADESRKGGPAAVILSYPFWQRQFKADRSIIGKAVTLNQEPVTVIGVLPETFDFGAVFAPGTKVDVFSPVLLDDHRDEGNTMALIGRLKPGVTIGQAQEEAKTLFPKLYSNRKYPESRGYYTAHPGLLKEYVSGKLRQSLLVLWGAVGMILLIVCVNLCSLMLARSAARTKEFSVRRALGAGPGRLIRQLLTESLVLSVAGAVLGLGIAFGITSYLAHQGSIALPLLSQVRIDRAALGWTLLITMVATAIFGLLPNLRMSSEDLQSALKDGGKGMGDGRRSETLRSTLVISEVALACVLLIGAGLLLRSFIRVLDVDLGFRPVSTATIKVDYDDGGSIPKRSAIFQDVLQRVRALPGVEAVGITDNLPLERNRSWGGPGVKGKHYARGERPSAFVYITSPGYLRAMGMPLRGRDFSWEDTATHEKVMMVNETVAHALWPNDDAIGRVVELGDRDARIVGVVADVHESNAESAAGWQMYMPMTQEEPEGAELVVRTKLPPEQLAGSVLQTLRSLNPNQPAVEFRTVQGIVDRAVSPRRFFVMLVAVFAGLGLVLASLGIYGVISYSVTRRTQEIGIRMALGATARRVQMGVMSKTLRLTVIGIAVGVVVSVVAGRVIASMLFKTGATDPVTYGAMVVLLGVVAALAGYLPARRASRIDPMVALRTN